MATPTYTPIETYTLGSPATTVTFGAGNTLPQTYTDLVIVLQGTQDSSYSARNMGIRFNGDTGSNYCAVQVLNASAGTDTNLASLYGPLINSSTNTTNGVFADGIINVQNYSNSTTYKSIICYGGTAAQYTSGGTNVGTYVGFNASTWLNTNPVTQITLYASNVSGPGSGASWAAGSTFTLYGIANSNIGAPKATGGIITYDNTYYYHTFGASGTFTPQQNLTNVDYLVIAGGASGSGGGGGGGAGGLRSTVDVTGGGGALESKISLTSGTPYTITVGAGGTSTTNTYDIGNAGNPSSIAGSGLTTITAAGGGGGGGADDSKDLRRGQPGGSGGGGAYNANTGYGAGGAATPSGQGYAGGSVINTYGTAQASYSAGGGGAGAAGANITTSSTNSSNGGIGVAIPTIANVTGTGVATYYAGGGGGGIAGTGSQTTSGGAGGGGGGRTAAGQNGVVNTGGGGGGTGGQNGSSVSGAGGSGLVVIRYAKA